ncbi:hypothetical protein [Streptomyces hydrogenans]|uniref:Uncharacterized protein n=1 Tax=Streptomyces hydrogenans TaxID=1873719 RepID=A0ABQ3PS69_9ACTN|nr:hypothetical protein [Streptomyces hydrogenans]GHG41042.1 hypothetical protein GCM10018784_63520 [Streptomyces hydrogenans]GHI27829.1 hypothetical protein Shyd_92000 [Streptomyces hydrogenans]
MENHCREAVREPDEHRGDAHSDPHDHPDVGVVSVLRFQENDPVVRDGRRVTTGTGTGGRS